MVNSYSTYGMGCTYGGYTSDQYGAVATSGGRRKHLNLLISDQAVENRKTYRRDYFANMIHTRVSLVAKGEAAAESRP